MFYVDAAYGKDEKDRKSVSEFCATLGGTAMYGKSKTQQRSQLAPQQRRLLPDRAATYLYGPNALHQDNEPAVLIAPKKKPCGRTRHIDTQLFALTRMSGARLSNAHTCMHQVETLLMPLEALSWAQLSHAAITHRTIHQTRTVRGAREYRC